jgi:endonuclease/exonuclease/phosphatase family metal-dependent hydrolase
MDLNAQQMRILGEIVNSKLKGREERVFLIGDFNRPPIGAPFALLKKQTSLDDSWLQLGLPEISTFNDYGKLDFFNDSSQRIDWILFSSDLKPQSVTVDRYRQTRSGKEDVFPSDHFPVIGKFSFD